jgi:hypothetical protein
MVAADFRAPTALWFWLLCNLEGVLNRIVYGRVIQMGDDQAIWPFACCTRT